MIVTYGCESGREKSEGRASAIYKAASKWIVVNETTLSKSQPPLVMHSSMNVMYIVNDQRNGVLDRDELALILSIRIWRGSIVKHDMLNH